MLLNEQQAAFAGAIWRGDTAPEIGATLPARFAIYRNNVFAGLANALAVRFPAVRRLLGDDCFRRCCLRFVSEHPPGSPVLGEYGGGFAAFLGNLTELTALPYLTDVARLEWACHQAMHGTDAVVLASDALAGIEPAHVADLVFHPHPAVRLLRSDYPIRSIWRTNMFDTQTRVIAADTAGESVLVSRIGDDVSVISMAQPVAAFTEALFGGATLGDAAAILDTGFALAPALATLLRAHAFTTFDLNVQLIRTASCSSTG